MDALIGRRSRKKLPFLRFARGPLAHVSSNRERNAVSSTVNTQ
jgi:hypothetical protein